MNERSPRATVAVLPTEPTTVLEDIARLCELAGLERALDEAHGCVLKAELAWHFPQPGANTTPWQLEGVLRVLAAKGLLEDVLVLQSEAPVTRAERAAGRNNIEGVLQRFGTELHYLSQRHQVPFTPYRPRCELRRLHHLFPEGLELPACLFGRNLISLPTAKCHSHAGLAGALLSNFSTFLGARRGRAYGFLDEVLTDLLALSQEVCPGQLHIMDATTAGDGPGPRTLRPVVKNRLLASSDPVALDAVAARLMGLDPLALPGLRLAQERGLGMASPSGIEVVGMDVSGECWNFSPTTNLASGAERVLRWGALSPLGRRLLDTPAQRALSAASRLYHDHYRWPRHERATFEEWRRNTAWGALFARYEAGEAPDRPR